MSVFVWQQPVKQYDERLTLAEGLTEYLEHYRLGDGGYTDRWFTLSMPGRISFPVPNIRNRAEAVRFHDLHHVLTGYDTGYAGEAEIGAWEIASGCGRYWSAWLLNFGSFSYGMVAFPRRVYRAFVRGNQSRSLYRSYSYEVVLDASVGAMREQLHIPSVPSHRWGDALKFSL